MTEAEADTFQDPVSPEAPGLKRVRPYLFVVLECDRPTSGGACHALTGIDEVIIGRGLERTATRQTIGGVNQLTVRVPGKSMSSVHARITRSEEAWTLQDMCSTNGSSVNGKRLEKATLRDGDVIELGHTLFMVQLAVPTPPRTPPDFDSLHTAMLDPALTTLNPDLAAEFSMVAHVARSDLPVLLLGETGTGKEVLARAIHRISGRRGAFIGVNCGAIPANLVESQLFGHVKGAFTGATRDEAGFIRSAEGGTLLLDEIGDLPLSAQPALLRVLQEGEVVAVGSSRPTHVDVRFIAATHRRLDSLLELKSFREDLLARLNIYRFELPSLARRVVDVGLLIAQISKEEMARPLQLSPDAGVALATHPWPFNIRELVAVLRRGAVLATEGRIEGRHLGLTTAARPAGEKDGQRPTRPPRLHGAALKDELVRRLEQSQGNIAEVARSMGKARMQVHRWMQRFGIEPSSFRADDRRKLNGAS